MVILIMSLTRSMCNGRCSSARTYYSWSRTGYNCNLAGRCSVVAVGVDDVHGKARASMFTLMIMCALEQIGRRVVHVCTVLVVYEA